MSQPDWRFVTNLGDANPIDHGGFFLYVDATGVYAPEAVLVVPPEQDPDFPFDGKKANLAFDEDSADEMDADSIPRKYKWELYTVVIEPCTYKDGILSDNKFHPDKAAWFAGPESRRAERPQDTTYLKNIVDAIGLSEAELIEDFLSPDVRERAMAWKAVGEIHGFENFDHEPTRLTKAEVEERFEKEIEIETARRRRGEHRTFRPCWTHHPRGGFVTGYASDPYDGIYSLERKLCSTVEGAALGLGWSAPDAQVYPGEPPIT